MQQGQPDCVSEEQIALSALSSQNPKDKKFFALPSRRILKHHDLDRLLVYEKRGTKQRKDFFQVCAQRAKNNEQAKKQRKKQKMQQKICQNQLIKQQQKPAKKAIQQVYDGIATKSTNQQPEPLHQKEKQQQQKKLTIKQKTVYKYRQKNPCQSQPKQNQKCQEKEKQKQRYQVQIKERYQERYQQRQKQKQRDKDKYQYQGQESESGSEFKFPLVNAYYSINSQEFLDTMALIDKARQMRHKVENNANPNSNPNQNNLNLNNTFINCDVKYFNWDLFIEQIGKFDVLVIDPPWRIKGAQKNDSQFMFSNCRFSLEYNTMSNHQIRQLPLHLISDEGFIFLWILNTQLNSSLEIMQEWGYELVEELIWVKLRNEKVYLTHGYYFMHSYQMCLVGYKNKRKDGSMSVRFGANPNVIFGEVRKKSQKPQDVYNVIEMVFKGKRKLEIFARNHNIRFGLFSIGNQLGQAYDKWMLHLNCDNCQNPIKSQSKRFKSKKKPNYDLCQQCMQSLSVPDSSSPSQSTEVLQKSDFFQFANEVDQDIRHEYLSCNLCGIEPIWGIRFQCLTCMDYDLCQSCYDRYLMLRSLGQGEKEEKEEKEEGKEEGVNKEKVEIVHPADHEFRTLEVPVFGYGFAIHEYKCNSCYQNPIIGVCFSCTSCKNFKLCQKCFFQRPRHERLNSSKSHRHNHQFEAIFQPLVNEQKKYECFNCKKIIFQGCWMCENCYNFFFCEGCYQERDKFKSLYANTHKKYHVFSKLF